MNQSGDRCFPSVVDVGHGTGNRPGSRDASEEGGDDICGALSQKLLIRVVLVSGHPVGDRCRQQGFDGSEYGDRNGCREEVFNDFPAHIWHGDSR